MFELKQALSLNIFNVDAWNNTEVEKIYAFMIYKKKTGNRDDGVVAVLRNAGKLKISIESHDLPKAQRLEKKRSTNSK